MEIKIEKAKENDLEKIKEIFLAGAVDESKIQEPNKSVKKIKEEMLKEMKQIFKDYPKELKSKNNYWIIAKIDGKIVGFATAEIKRKDEGWLQMNYVEKEYRRKGIGKKLTDERVKWFKKKKTKYICSTALVKNKPSLKNLERIGLKPRAYKMMKETKWKQ
jgi:GNAT superfamily N-acetyltransferase